MQDSVFLELTMAIILYHQQGVIRKAIRVGKTLNQQHMKNLMKLLLVLFICVSTTSIYAQKFGLVAGLNIANMHVDGDNTGPSPKNKIGFHVGPTIELPINNSLSFASGLLFSNKGFTYEESIEIWGSTIDMDATLNLYYIDIPLTAKGYLKLGNAQFYGVLGPYCSIGLTGDIKMNMSFMGESQSATETVTWGNGLNRVDMGATAGAGVAVNNFSLGVTYNYGLAGSLQNRVFAVSLGYQFAQK